MGNVQEVFSVYPENKTLPVEVDTVADLMIRHDSGSVSQIHLDYIQRPFQRSGTISGEKGWIRYDLANPGLWPNLPEIAHPAVFGTEQNMKRISNTLTKWIPSSIMSGRAGSDIFSMHQMPQRA